MGKWGGLKLEMISLAPSLCYIEDTAFTFEYVTAITYRSGVIWTLGTNFCKLAIL